MAARALALAAIACASLLIVSCGAEQGVAENATVTVYATAPPCASAKQEAARSGNRAGGLQIRLVCLRDAEANDRLDLATIGANARRAVEDSSTVAYIGEPTRAATEFSRPILESAKIAQLSQIPGAAAMKQLLQALEQTDTSSPRESLSQTFS